MVKKKGATGGDEYEAYITQSPTDIEGSVLEWWMQDTQHRQWPRLSPASFAISGVIRLGFSFALSKLTLSCSQKRLCVNDSCR